MDTTAKGLAPFSVGLRYSRRGAGGTRHAVQKKQHLAPPPVLVAGTEGKRPWECSEGRAVWGLTELAGALEGSSEILG